MCGILGHLRREGVAPHLDLQSLRHRGPDAHGEWQSKDGRVCFGHTRLAILDLSPAGAQPMVDPVTGNVIVFNGEIYNHLILRQELDARKNAWRGSSDTETLLVGFRRWGLGMLRRLKGMFAFAIYDAAQRSLLVVRDRLGIKPLYFASGAGHFRFASETRALRTSQNPTPSERAVAAFLQWGSCPDDLLLASGISALPAGHWMQISAEAETRVEQYWPDGVFAGHAGPPAERIRQLVERAVEEHLLSDVPVGSFLSGGIDSSIVTAIAARRLGGRLRTFSVGFRETGFDETEVAAEVAGRYGTQHTRIELDERETLLSVQEAVAKMDLPSVDAINTYIVARAVARQGVKVALSGLGGDELFGGYPSFRDAPRLALLGRLPQSLKRALTRCGSVGGRLADLPCADAPTMAAWRRCFWSGKALLAAGLPAEPLHVRLPPGLPDNFARISWVELSRYMRWMLLRDSDQMSMAVSLELRVPFLDHELVEFALSLPARVKQGGRHPKRLLIEACRDLLPTSVFDRPKRGFALPMDSWMRGPLAAFVAEGALEVERQGVVRREWLAQLQARFAARSLHWTRLWSVVVLGHYLARTAQPGASLSGVAGGDPRNDANAKTVA